MPTMHNTDAHPTGDNTELARGVPEGGATTPDNSKKETSTIVAIGDIHGRDIWKRIVEQEIHATREIFVGDYMDSYVVPPATQIKNLCEILEYKRENPERVVLLVGNHDFHYLTDLQAYSGYQSEEAEAIKGLLMPAIKNGDMKIAHIEDGYLFTHAGVTKTWLKNYGVETISEEELQLLFEQNQAAFFFDKRDQSGYGEAIFQSPIWVRPKSLLTDLPDSDLIQVVGHTHQENIEPSRLVNFIDVFDTTEEYLRIVNGKAEVGHVQKS